MPLLHMNLIVLFIFLFCTLLWIRLCRRWGQFLLGADHVRIAGAQKHVIDRPAILGQRPLNSNSSLLQLQTQSFRCQRIQNPHYPYSAPPASHPVVFQRNVYDNYCVACGPQSTSDLNQVRFSNWRYIFQQYQQRQMISDVVEDEMECFSCSSKLLSDA